MDNGAFWEVLLPNEIKAVLLPFFYHGKGIYNPMNAKFQTKWTPTFCTPLWAFPYIHHKVSHWIHNLNTDSINFLTNGTLYFLDILGNECPLEVQELHIHPFTNLHKAISKEPFYCGLPRIQTQKTHKEWKYKDISILTLKHSLFSTVFRTPNQMSTTAYLGMPYSQLFIFLSFSIHKMDWHKENG